MEQKMTFKIQFDIIVFLVEFEMQAILKSADIRALVKGVEVDYSVIIKVRTLCIVIEYKVKRVLKVFCDEKYKI